MLAPDDTTKYESTLRRSNGISMYNYDVTPKKRRFVYKVIIYPRKLPILVTNQKETI